MSFLAKPIHKGLKVDAAFERYQQKKVNMDDLHGPIARTFENEKTKMKHFPNYCSLSAQDKVHTRYLNVYDPNKKMEKKRKGNLDGELGLGYQGTSPENFQLLLNRIPAVLQHSLSKNAKKLASTRNEMR